MTAARRALAAGLLLLAAAGGSAPAEAVAPPVSPTLASAVFSISPARRTLVATPPVRLTPTVVRNTTTTRYRVKAFPVVLGQALDGSFTFDDHRAPRQKAARLLSASPSAFDVPAGGQLPVTLRWKRTPKGAPAAYMGIVYQGTPVTRRKTRVRVVTRLLSVNFLRAPGPSRVDGAISQVRVAGQPRRRLAFTPRLRNDGNVAVTPTRIALTVTSGGRTVLTRRLKTVAIIPGAEVDAGVVTRKLLPRGVYTARVTARFGRAGTRTASHRFRLVAPNVLPTPRVRLSGFAAAATTGEPIHVRARVASVGTAPAGTKLAVAVYRTGSQGIVGTPVATKVVPVAPLAPGRARDVAVTLGDEARGR